MKTVENTKEIIIEVCNHCGKDVSRSSGRFANRVPDCNDIMTRIDNGLKFPLGDYVCNDCDLKTSSDF